MPRKKRPTPPIQVPDDNEICVNLVGNREDRFGRITYPFVVDRVDLHRSENVGSLVEPVLARPLLKVEDFR